MGENLQYLEALKKLQENFSQYIEIDNRIDEIPKEIWNIGDYIICINNNFYKDDESHGHKEGITIGKIYKIISVVDEDRITINDDIIKNSSYFKWRFFKV